MERNWQNRAHYWFKASTKFHNEKWKARLLDFPLVHATLGYETGKQKWETKLDFNNHGLPYYLLENVFECLWGRWYIRNQKEHMNLCIKHEWIHLQPEITFSMSLSFLVKFSLSTCFNSYSTSGKKGVILQTWYMCWQQIMKDYKYPCRFQSLGAMNKLNLKLSMYEVQCLAYSWTY